MKKKKEIKIKHLWLVLGIIGIFAIGFIIGTKAFPDEKVVYVQNDDGNYCFDKDYKTKFETEDNNFKEYVNCITSILSVRDSWAIDRLNEAVEDLNWNSVILVKNSIIDDKFEIKTKCESWNQN